MRSLSAIKEKERRRKKNQTIVGIVLVVLMIFSTAGFALQGIGFGSQDNVNNENRIVYNGFEFLRYNDFWVLGNFAFRYNPKEVENISFNLELENIKDMFHYSEKPLYVYSESSEAKFEIDLNMGQIAERIQGACPSHLENSDNVECDETLPRKTCSDNLIIIRENKENNISRIYQEENCVYIEGSQEEITKLTDLFLFKVLNIM